MYRKFGSISLNLFSKAKDTIYALSTGTNTAISIIRICGPNAHRSLQTLCRQKQNIRDMQGSEMIKQLKIKPRYAHFKKIYNSKEKVIDEGLVLYFPKQQSYNNEELFQFHLHGSRAVVNAVFGQLKKLGMRMAERGQFTKRGVLNGKLNIFQAQAINDLVRSQSEFGRQIAVNHLLGKNIDFLDKIRNNLVKSLAKNQAFIDFNQDESDVKDDLFDKTKQQVKEVYKQIVKVIRNYKNLQITKDGINIAIIGRPNVGKSTLINSLSQQQVSIVSDEPGTTRDIVHVSIQSEGFLINLYDTAGLRQTTSYIQSEGIKRAKQKIHNSHYKLLIIDLSQQVYEIEDNSIVIKIDKQNQLQNIDFDNKTYIVLNKSDAIQPQLSIKGKKLCIQVTEQDMSKKYRKQINALISAHDDGDVQKLMESMTQKLQQQYGIFRDSSQQIYFTRQRYFDKLQVCRELLQLYLQEERVDLSCQYLRNAIAQISEIFGRVDAEDVLDVLFKQFCIGK